MCPHAAPFAHAEIYTFDDAPPEALGIPVVDGEILPGWNIGVTIDSEMAWVEITAPDGRCASLGTLRFRFSQVTGGQVETVASVLLREFGAAIDSTTSTRVPS